MVRYLVREVRRALANMTIRNGLYHIRIEMLDAVQGGNQGVMVLRDGTMRGGCWCRID
jgi:hypothetical protein